LVPLQSPRQPGGLAGRMGEEIFDPLPVDELAAWKGR
jgi:hypothetical protein